MVAVMYKNGIFDLVARDHLDKLIATGWIKKFQRSDGWAIVGEDPLRGPEEFDYDGEDRRAV